MKNRQADLLGIASAVLCIIHCLLVPLFILYGLVAEFVISRWEYLDWGFVLLSGIAVYLATRHEGSRHEYSSPEDNHYEYERSESGRYLSHQMWAVWVVFTITLLLHESWPPALYISVLSSVGLAYLHFQHFRRKHTATVAK